MSLLAPSLNYLWKAAAEFGLDPQKLFEDAGIDPNLRLDVNARVSAHDMDELLWRAKQQSHDNAFVFKLAEQMHPSYMGALGYAWMTSPSLRKAFERLSRYIDMVYDELEVRLDDRDGFFHVRIETSESQVHDPALRERDKLAIAVQLCRMIYGKEFHPTRVCFTHARPSNANEYYAFFHCEVVYDASHNEIVMPVAVADEELVGFNPQLVHKFDELIVEYLQQRDRSDIVGRTRNAIFEELPSGEVSLERTAGMLNMSSRTLARKLGEEGASFKSLLNEVRQELAEKYIRDRSLTLTEISFLLGFAEISSFSRAYRGWNGASPSTHRDQLLGARGEGFEAI
jgi:AraC-like DNA-binding protein